MPFSLAPTVSRIDAVSVAELPVGKWALFGLGLGVSTAVINALKVADIKSYFSGPGLAYAVKKVGMVRTFLGDTLTQVIAISAGTAMLEDQFQMSDKIRKGIASAAGAIGLADERKKLEIQYGPDVDLDALIVDLQEASAALKAAGGGTTTGPWLGEIGQIPAFAPMPAIPQTAGPSRMGGMPAGPEYSEVESILSQIAF